MVIHINTTGRIITVKRNLAFRIRFYFPYFSGRYRHGGSAHGYNLIELQVSLSLNGPKKEQPHRKKKCFHGTMLNSIIEINPV